jgi:hypothetical protein
LEFSFDLREVVFLSLERTDFFVFKPYELIDYCGVGLLFEFERIQFDGLYLESPFDGGCS